MKNVILGKISPPAVGDSSRKEFCDGHQHGKTSEQAQMTVDAFGATQDIAKNVTAVQFVQALTCAYFVM